MRHFFHLILLWMLFVLLEAILHRFISWRIDLPLIATFLVVATVEAPSGPRHPLHLVLPLAVALGLAAEIFSGLPPGLLLSTYSTLVIVVFIVHRIFSFLTPMAIALIAFFAVLIVRFALAGMTPGVLTHGTVGSFSMFFLIRILLPALFAVPLAFLWQHLLARPFLKRLTFPEALSTRQMF